MIVLFEISCAMESIIGITSFFFFSSVIFTKENVADLVLHLQCIDIQKATFTTIGSRTVQHYYRRGARQTIQTRE